MIPTQVPAYTDFAQLAELKAGVQAKSGENLREVARQFEAVFTHMMIRSMRQASLGDTMFNTNSMDTYQGMFDQRIALAMSQGKGLGIAEAMLRQLEPPRAQPNLDKALPASGSTAVRTTPMAMPIKQPVSEVRALPLNQNDGTNAEKTLPNPQAVASTRKQAALKAYGAITAIWPDVASRNPLQPGSLFPNGSPTYIPSAGAVIRPEATDKKSDQASPESFIARIWPAARKTASELGLSPRVLVAQAALETGWGRFMPKHADGSSSNNLFGIKTHGQWNGQAVTSSTSEIVNGKTRTENALFRAYDSIEASFRDFAAFLKRNPRYREALSVSGDANKFVDALQKAGYATDPEYADKIKSIMNGHRMNTMIASIEPETRVT